MAHPDKDSGIEQKDRFMQNFVKSRSRSLANGKDENSIQFVKDCVTLFRISAALCPLVRTGRAVNGQEHQQVSGTDQLVSVRIVSTRSAA